MAKPLAIDIVLRCPLCGKDYEECPHAFDDLTDEIERLRTGVEKEVYSRVEHWRSSVEAKDAEIERLREALEAAHEYIDHATGALPIIRAALSQKEDNQWPLHGSPGLYDPIKVHE